jgi:hypothetical protein
LVGIWYLLLLLPRNFLSLELIIWFVLCFMCRGMHEVVGILGIRTHAMGFPFWNARSLVHLYYYTSRRFSWWGQDPAVGGHSQNMGLYCITMEDIKSTMGPYYRQYKIMVYFFFPWLPNFWINIPEHKYFVLSLGMQ